MDSALLLSIELLAVASSGVALWQARLQFRRAARLRGARMAVVSLVGAPLASLGLVLLFTRGGSVIAGIIAIALTLVACVLAYGDRRRWRVRKDYRLGLIALGCDLAGSALMTAVMLGG
ncbi:MAG TPA: hypothetical protein VLA64_06425 [Azonexus sp.]|nr:hypothetical protein [Azonexus sp.]